MKRIFVSYARSDRLKAEEIVSDIAELGFNAWFDEKLTGGQLWWDEILRQIQGCDIFVIVVSGESCASPACMREIDYADALGKTVLPIALSLDFSASLLPPRLGVKQLIRYHTRDRESLLQLNKAINTCGESKLLPEPLPESPPVPVSYLGKATEALSQESLSLDQQCNIVNSIEDGLKDDSLRDDARQVLERLACRRDLYKKVSDDIERLRNTKPAKLSRSLSANADNGGTGFLPTSLAIGILVGLLWMMPGVNLTAIPIVIAWFHFFAKPRTLLAGPVAPWVAYALMLIFISLQSVDVYLFLSVASGLYVGFRIVQARKR